MAKRFKTSDNYFIVSDTETGVEELREGKSNISYKEFDGRISFYLVSTGTIISVEIYNKDNVVNGDNGDAPFPDLNAIKDFLDVNTAGFNSASGGSGALAVADKFIFQNDTARDNYFLNHPDEKTKGVTILVESPVLTLERWDGNSWYKNTSVIKGDKGDTGSQGVKGDKGDKGLQGIQGIQGPQGPKGDTGTVDPSDLNNVLEESYTSLDHNIIISGGRGYNFVGGIEFDGAKNKITKVTAVFRLQNMERVNDVDYVVRDLTRPSISYFTKIGVGGLDDGVHTVDFDPASIPSTSSKVSLQVLCRKRGVGGAFSSQSVQFTFANTKS